MTIRSLWAVCILLCASFSSSAQVDFVPVGSGLVAVPVAPGASTQFEFTLRNVGSSAASRQLKFSGTRLTQYQIVANGLCPLPTIGGTQLMVPANGSLRCTYRVQRAKTEARDLALWFELSDGQNPSKFLGFTLGDLVRLELSQQIERLPATGRPGRVQITVQNAGPSAVGILKYGQCSTGSPSVPQVRVVGGQCSTGSGVFCEDVVSMGFTMSDLPAGASRSCTLEWDALPGLPHINLHLTLLSKRTDDFVELENTNADSYFLNVRGIPETRALPVSGGLTLLMLFGLIGLLVLRTRVRH